MMMADMGEFVGDNHPAVVLIIAARHDYFLHEAERSYPVILHNDKRVVLSVESLAPADYPENPPVVPDPLAEHQHDTQHQTILGILPEGDPQSQCRP